MTYAPVNGLQLYYEIRGNDWPLVLLHGGLLTIDLNFGPMLEPLAASRQVIAVELQGHGHTGVRTDSISSSPGRTSGAQNGGSRFCWHWRRGCGGGRYLMGQGLCLEAVGRHRRRSRRRVPGAKDPGCHPACAGSELAAYRTAST
jgi:hypothetical protein